MKKNSLKIVLIVIFFISTQACKESNQTKIADVIPNTGLIEDISVPGNLYPSDTIIIATHSEWTKTHYPKRIAEFKKNPLETGDIVFLGNSITEQGGDWEAKVNSTKAKNRGISGDTTEGVLARLAELIYYKPEQVFILIGINDLFREDMTSEKVFNNILKIVDQIHDGSPRTKIFVQTILPTNTVTLKEKIQSTNSLLTNSEATAPYTLISLHTHFATQDDIMNMELSVDGVHLNENGYAVWVDKIINLIKK
jgi:lysophospholipase L1-like esterase